jgi:CubicO group peptidase (beta-lactamase class C family)
MRLFQIAAVLAATLFCAPICRPAQADDLLPFPPQPANTPYPTAAWPEMEATSAARRDVEAVVARAFADGRPEALAKTKAVLVVSRGLIAAEQYADGITRDTRLQSWSMAKSFLHAALGLAIAQGKINPQAPAPVPEWQSDGDARKAITIRQLAQMASGLAFREDYGNAHSEAMQMLFGDGRGDVGRAAASTPAVHAPGTFWSYSSGSANILSRVLRDALGGGAAYHDFLKTQLFAPLGMTSAIAEFDASGTWVASSYVHATARDFARLGMLYLRGGVWEGKQIVPRAWVDVGRTPTLASKGQYGALFWLNARNGDTGKAAIAEDVPVDAFFARGFGGQLILIVPSRDVVIVMLNAAYSDDASAIVKLLADILKALPPSPGGG